MIGIERTVSLAACPVMACRRDKICHKLAKDQQCLKTHFADMDEFLVYLTERIMELKRQSKSKPCPKRMAMTEADRINIMYKALKARERELQSSI